MNEQTFDKLVTGLEKAFPTLDFGLTNHRRYVTLDKLVVPKHERKQGLGTRFIIALIKEVNDHGTVLTLTPDTLWGGTSKNRLRKFYRRFGFVNNRNRNKDFTISDSMYRLPRIGETS